MSNFLKCVGFLVMCAVLYSANAYAGWSGQGGMPPIVRNSGPALDPPGNWFTFVCLPPFQIADVRVTVAPTAVDTYASHPSASCSGTRTGTLSWSVGGPHWSEYHFEYLVRISYLIITSVTAVPEVGEGGVHGSIVGSVHFSQNYEEVSQTIYGSSIMQIIPGVGTQTGWSELEDGTITWNPIESGVFTKTYQLGLNYIEISDSTPCLGSWATTRRNGFSEAGAYLDRGSAEPADVTSAYAMVQCGMAADAPCYLRAVLD